MGQGIAKAFAQTEGYEVALCDIKQEWAEGGKDKIVKGYAKLVEKGKMTQDQVDAVMNGYSVVVEPNWSADGASEYLNQKFTEIIDTAVANTGKLFIYSMDDEMTFGVLNTLDTQITGTPYEAKAEGLEMYCSAIGGMQELYDVMSGKDATRAAVCEKYFDDIMSMYFSPKMMSDVIDKGLEFLGGNWPYKQGDGFYTPVFMVTKDTAGITEGFTGH